MKQFTVQGLTAPDVIDWGDNVFDAFVTALDEESYELSDGDIVVVTSKVISMEKKNRVKLEDVDPTTEAKDLATESEMDPRVVQIVMDEAIEIFGSVPHAILCKTPYGLSANAGIDLSNCPDGYALLLPRDPDRYARSFRKQVRDAFDIDVAVLITDSRTIPLKLGTTGITLGIAGMRPIIDERGTPDLYGYEMTVTTRGLADNLATTANIVMGETDERRPFAVVRGIDYEGTDELVTMESTLMPEDKCLYFGPVVKVLRGDQSWL